MFEDWRYKIAWGGRGGAKSWNFAIALLILAIKFQKRILCARETMESIQQSVHQLLKDQITRLELNSHYDVQKASIIGRNGSLFTFAGLSHNVMNIKSLEAYDIVWVEEAQTVSKDSWETLIPTLRKEGSEIWASFNPKLPTDETYKRFVLTKRADAKVVKINWQDNPWFPQVLRAEKDFMREHEYETYLHVYEGECAKNVEGAIYSNEMKAVREEKRITLVPYNKAYPVHTFWDLGYGDLTTIWFVQVYDGYFHFIDYHQDSGKTITDYLIFIQRKQYLYGTVWLPFDGVDTIIHKKLAGNRDMSIEMIVRNAGFTVRIVPKVLIADRLNAARTIFPRCRFDETKCADGLQALDWFQWGPVNELGVHKKEPLHNIHSHAAEAFTRAGQVLRQPHIEEDLILPEPEPEYYSAGYTPYA